MNSRKTQQLNILLADIRDISAGPTDGSSPAPHKQHSAIARQLVASALEAYLGRTPSPEELAGEVRGEHGKPCFPAFPAFHYNISHSGDFVVCAVSDRPVGIDIQQISENADRPMKIASHFFSKEEQEALQALRSDPAKNTDSTEPSSDLAFCTLFTRYWTAREAYIKLNGLGLSESFAGYRPDLESGRIITSDGPTAFLIECEAPEGYRMTACSYEQIDSCKFSQT